MPFNTPNSGQTHPLASVWSLLRPPCHVSRWELHQPHVAYGISHPASRAPGYAYLIQ
jgi:hypothetical protein